MDVLLNIGRIFCEGWNRTTCPWVMSPVRYHFSTSHKSIGELGFEPRLTESKSAVLPLDDSPTKTGVVGVCNFRYNKQIGSFEGTTTVRYSIFLTNCKIFIPFCYSFDILIDDLIYLCFIYALFMFHCINSIFCQKRWNQNHWHSYSRICGMSNIK